jgi:hypothetical protein
MRRKSIGVALALVTLLALLPGSPAHAAAPSGPTLAIDTPGALTDLQAVTMTGRGLTPGDTLFFMECQQYGNLCTYWTDVSGVVNDAGTLTLTATAHRYVDDYMDRLPRDDCAYVDCGFAFVRRGDYEDGYLVVAETIGHFARTQPATPTASIEAHSPLPAVVSTHAVGHGFAPGSRVLPSRCFVPRPGNESCDKQTVATTDAHGDVSVPIELRRIGVGYLAGVDCADPALLCSVRLESFDYGATARVPLVYDPTSFPPPAPTITVTPQLVRHVAARVTVTGQGFRPLHEADVSGPGDYHSATVDASGSFTTTLDVQRYMVSLNDSMIDCARRGACSVAASTGPDDVAASTPITFAAHSDDPTLVLDGATVAEGSGTTAASFRVHLDRPASVPVTFWYASGLGGVPSDPNLSYAFGTEEIPAGQTELSVPIVVHGDRLDQADRHTGFGILELSGAQLAGRPLIPITVRDDDRRPALRVGSTTVRETDGLQFVSVPVTLNAPSGRDVTVGWVTHHDTARSGTDYVRLRGTLTIPAGQQRGTITVAVLGDRVHETSERFHVALDDPVNAVIADHDAVVTIHDDD